MVDVTIIFFLRIEVVMHVRSVQELDFSLVHVGLYVVPLDLLLASRTAPLARSASDRLEKSVMRFAFVPTCTSQNLVFMY